MRRVATIAALTTGACILVPAVAGFIVGYRRAWLQECQLCRALS